jgi:sulfur carrier protein
MKVTINGEEEALSSEQTNVLELLKHKNVEMPDMVSVELNGEFLDRESYGGTQIKDGDEVEFLYFMGGGTSRV